MLRAYEQACAICRLEHVDLLDAAHILSDAAGGQPVVPNSLSLCEVPKRASERPDRDLLEQR